MIAAVPRPFLHRALDRLAMGLEDLVRRAPQPYRPGPDRPPEPFGPLGRLPAAPDRAGSWSAPSPPPYGNDRLRVHVAPARAPRRGTAVIVPPWKVRARALLHGWVRLAQDAGLDAWLLVPPHHLDRAGAGARGGEGFVSPDLGRLRAALEQTVLEVRLLLALAAARGAGERVALVGLSLGALAAAWAAAGPERVDATALVAPPADLAAVFAKTPIGRRYAALAARAGAPLPGDAELTSRLALLAPPGRRPTSGRVLVAAGDADAIAVGGPAALARAWNVPLSRHARGHLTLLFGCRALRRDVADLLRTA